MAYATGFVQKYFTIDMDVLRRILLKVVSMLSLSILAHAWKIGMMIARNH